MVAVIRLVIDDIPVEIRRNSRRKTRIGLAFDPAGHLILDAPEHASTADLEAAVIEHKRWISHRLVTLSEQRDPEVRSSSYRHGDLVNFLGDSLKLTVVQGGARKRISLEGANLIVPHPEGPDSADVQARVRAWYRKQAADIFGQIIARSVELPWVDTAPAWRQQFMKSQWGSCSARGHIALNTHLVQAPTQLIEYVVMHELCHLKYMNHNSLFYALLERHMPDWQLRRKALAKYVPILLRG
jgi:predicted metal-dependent hydrolase